MDTNLDSGETNIICGPCLPAFSVGMAAALTVGMTLEVANELAPVLDELYANDPRGKWVAASAATKSRRGKGAQSADGATDAPAPTDTGKDAGDPASGSQTATEPPEATAVVLDPPCSQCGSGAATGDRVKLVCDGCGAVIATADEVTG